MVRRLCVIVVSNTDIAGTLTRAGVRAHDSPRGAQRHPPNEDEIDLISSASMNSGRSLTDIGMRVGNRRPAEGRHQTTEGRRRRDVASLRHHWARVRTGGRAGVSAAASPGRGHTQGSRVRGKAAATRIGPARFPPLPVGVRPSHRDPAAAAGSANAPYEPPGTGRWIISEA